MGICVVSLAPAMRIMISSTYQPLRRILLKREMYFMILRRTLFVANCSLIYVNSMNFILMYRSR